MSKAALEIDDPKAQIAQRKDARLIVKATMMAMAV